MPVLLQVVAVTLVVATGMAVTVTPVIAMGSRLFASALRRIRRCLFLV
ncbi:MAG: hypothetical protein M1399_06410 [Actinobacteria bacterium]|nr:hypothetical protein [Actinomycetota bacterium]